MAEHLYAGGKFYNSNRYSYFQRSVNNVNIAIIFSWILAIVGNFRRVIYIGALLTNVSAILSSLTIYHLTGSKKVSIVFLIAGEILFAVTWRSFIPYTDNFGMFFVAAVLFLYTSQINAEVKYPLILIATACGIFVKITTLITFLGICIHFILNKKWLEIDKLRLSRCLATTVLTCGILLSFFLFIKPAIYQYYGYEVDDSKKTRITFFLMVGQNTKNYGTVGLGNPGFNNIKNYSERSSAWFNEAVRRIKERGFIGNFDFYLEKIGVAYFDGLFHNVNASELGKSFLGRLYSIDGDLFFLGSNIAQLVWNAFILMWLFSGLLGKEKDIGFLWNITLGVTLYLLLFETRAKYLYMFAPVFTILAGVGFSLFYSQNKIDIYNKPCLKWGAIILFFVVAIYRMDLHTTITKESEKTKYAQNTFAEFPSLKPLNLITARIDIRNTGANSNDVHVCDISDSSASVKRMSWIKKGGNGKFIESTAGTISARIICTGSGKLRIELKGRDVRQEDGERIPYWIDYTSFSINGNPMLTEHQTVWHDKPHNLFFDVMDNDIVEISAAWSSGIEAIQKEALQELEEQKNQNKKMAAKISDMQNSKSWKIGRAITWPVRKLREHKQCPQYPAT